jgi:hypothetical protein
VAVNIKHQEGLPPDGVLCYIFNIITTNPKLEENLPVTKLGRPPEIVSLCSFSRGAAVLIGARKFLKGEKLEQHCFRIPYQFVDENWNALPQKIEPCGHMGQLSAFNLIRVAYHVAGFPLPKPDEIKLKEADYSYSKDKPYFNIKIPIDDGSKRDRERNLRLEIEDALKKSLKEKKLGSYSGAGSGDGVLDIQFDLPSLDKLDEAVKVIREELIKLKVPKGTVIEAYYGKKKVYKLK